MKVFLSHARKDGALARQLADQLTRSGFAVWIPEQEIEPGDNWAKKIGKAGPRQGTSTERLTGRSQRPGPFSPFLHRKGAKDAKKRGLCTSAVSSYNLLTIRFVFDNDAISLHLLFHFAPFAPSR
jgi:hypothetical protein